MNMPPQSVHSLNRLSVYRLLQLQLFARGELGQNGPLDEGWNKICIEVCRGFPDLEK